MDLVVLLVVFWAVGFVCGFRVFSWFLGVCWCCGSGWLFLLGWLFFGLFLGFFVVLPVFVDCFAVDCFAVGLLPLVVCCVGVVSFGCFVLWVLVWLFGGCWGCLLAGFLRRRRLGVMFDEFVGLRR